MALIVPALLQALVEELDWSPRFSVRPWPRSWNADGVGSSVPFERQASWPRRPPVKALVDRRSCVSAQRQAAAAAGQGGASQVAGQAADVQPLAVAGLQAPLVGERAGVDGDRAAGQLAAIDLLHRRAAGEHLDAVDQRVVAGAVVEGHRDLAAGVGRGRKALLDRLVLAPRRGEDVEIRQHLRAVDAHVELPLARRRSTIGGEVQGHRVARPRRQAARL